MAAQHVHAPLPPLAERNPRVPRAVSAIIGKMMAKRPEERYQDYGALIEDLHRARRGQAPWGAAPAGTAPEAPGRDAAGAAGTTGRQRLAWMAAGFAAALIAVLALAFVGRGGGEGVRPEDGTAQAEEPPAGVAEEPWSSPPSPDVRPQPPPDNPLAHRVLGALDLAYRTKSLGQLRVLAGHVELHLAEQGALPSDLPALAERLELHPQALVDGWGRAIRYQPLAGAHYRLTSLGRDGRAGTADDLVIEDGYVVQGEAAAPPWGIPDR